jgi:hypothetical protein
MSVSAVLLGGFIRMSKNVYTLQFTFDLHESEGREDDIERLTEILQSTNQVDVERAIVKVEGNQDTL